MNLTFFDILEFQFRDSNAYGIWGILLDSLTGVCLWTPSGPPFCTSQQLSLPKVCWKPFFFFLFRGHAKLRSEITQASAGSLKCPRRTKGLLKVISCRITSQTKWCENRKWCKYRNSYYRL